MSAVAYLTKAEIERVLTERIRVLEAENAQLRDEDDLENFLYWKVHAEKAEAALAAAYEHIGLHHEGHRHIPEYQWASQCVPFIKRAEGREAGKEPTVPHSPPCPWCGDDVHPGSECFRRTKPAAKPPSRTDATGDSPAMRRAAARMARRSAETQECGT